MSATWSPGTALAAMTCGSARGGTAAEQAAQRGHETIDARGAIHEQAGEIAVPLSEARQLSHFMDARRIERDDADREPHHQRRNARLGSHDVAEPARRWAWLPQTPAQSSSRRCAWATGS
jgi:hypothetical protein